MIRTTLLSAGFALLTAPAALAVGPDEDPPTPTETTTECAEGTVWDTDAQGCVAIEDSAQADDPEALIATAMGLFAAIPAVVICFYSPLPNARPIAAILFGFQVLVLRRSIKEPARVAMGMVFVLLGLTLFLQGLEQALFPLGRLMAI